MGFPSRWRRHEIGRAECGSTPIPFVISDASPRHFIVSEGGENQVIFDDLDSDIGTSRRVRLHGLGVLAVHQHLSKKIAISP